MVFWTLKPYYLGTWALTIRSSEAWGLLRATGPSILEDAKATNLLMASGFQG